MSEIYNEILEDMELIIKVEKQQLLKECNYHLSSIPSSKLTFDVKGATVQLSKIKLNDLKFTKSLLSISLTARVDVEKKTLLADVAGDGVVQLNCSTGYAISEDWQLQAKFNYDSHRWIDSPDVNIGIIHLPVKSLVDSAIEKQKDTIVETVNEQMNAISDLQKYIKPLLSYFTHSQKLAKATLQFSANVVSLLINDIEDNTDNIIIKTELIGLPVIHLSDVKPPKQELPEIILKRENES